MEQSKIPLEVLNKIKITNDEFLNALKDVHPSAMREVQIQRPNVKRHEIGRLEEVKDELAGGNRMTTQTRRSIQGG
jgi:transitional endoplasmic reticulum ATPase